MELNERAHHLAMRIYTPGKSKREADKGGTICAVGTFRNAKQQLIQYLRWRQFNDLRSDTQDRLIDITSYLEELSESMQQKGLDQARQSLAKIFHVSIPHCQSQVATILSTRSYSEDEVRLVIARMSRRNAISTMIAFSGGVRAHELATIRRVSESSPSPHREWDKQLFFALSDYVTFVVTGKGGLRRRIALPAPLAELIEQYRLPDLKRVCDRSVFYDMFYDLGFGQALSQSFSDASRSALGESTGLHGLRHSYAKRRTHQMKLAGLDLPRIQLIISQELGHFRPSITNAYYR
jgi:integrase